jgi:hypothetical protein
MTIEERIVRVHSKLYIVTISHRSKKAWVAVGDYAGRRIEVVGSSATNAARRWAAAVRCKGDALKRQPPPSALRGSRQREAPPSIRF